MKQEHLIRAIVKIRIKSVQNYEAHHTTFYKCDITHVFLIQHEWVDMCQQNCIPFKFRPDICVF